MYKDLEGLSLEQLGVQSQINVMSPLEKPSMAVSQHTGYSKSTHSSKISHHNKTNKGIMLSKSLDSASMFKIDTSSFDAHKPEVDKDNSALTSQELLNASMHDFQRLGYGNGKNAYKTHWIEKLHRYYLQCLQDKHVLTKEMVALKKQYRGDKNMTPSELFCALAETNGNVGEVCMKLNIFTNLQINHILSHMCDMYNYVHRPLQDQWTMNSSLKFAQYARCCPLKITLLHWRYLN